MGLLEMKMVIFVVATKLVGMGETIETSLGTGKRYDTCIGGNNVDIYTNW